MNSEAKELSLKYIDTNKTYAFAAFTDAFHQVMTSCRTKDYHDIVFVCIGTDRSTGDSLGPIIGYKLRGMKYSKVHVYGDLDNPIHAKNLRETIQLIQTRYNKPFIIAIDACLGKTEHVGYVTIGKGAIRPGSAVNKNLEPVGHMHITGIVNFSGMMDFLILQNTRLSTVMKIADVVSSGIKYVIWKITREDMLSEVKNGRKENSF